MGDDRKTERVIDATPDVTPAFVTSAPDASATEQPVDEDTVDPVEQALEEARQRGYREGREIGEAELRTEIERFRGEMSDSLRRLAELEQSLTQRHEKLLMEVALEAASRIVRTRIEDNDPVAVRAVREAMDTLPTGTVLRARLHPEDLRPASELLRSELELGRVELVSDASMTRGGARVESSSGTIDLTLETAEEAVRVAVVGAGDEA